MRLEGARALVTGGSAGIGMEITRLLLEKGAHVVVAARDARRGAAAFDAGSNVEILPADLALASEQARVVELATRRWPDLSILINNAGIQVNLPTGVLGDDGKLAEFRREIGLNLAAPVALSFGLMPLLAARPEAAIVNISSGVAIAPKRSAPVYCATKAGLGAFTTALRYRCEDAAPALRVLEVVLPLVDTAMTRGRGRGKMAPRQAAASIVSALEREDARVLIGKARLLATLDRLAPRLARRMLRDS